MFWSLWACLSPLYSYFNRLYPFNWVLCNPSLRHFNMTGFITQSLLIDNKQLADKKIVLVPDVLTKLALTDISGCSRVLDKHSVLTDFLQKQNKKSTIYKLCCYNHECFTSCDPRVLFKKPLNFDFPTLILPESFRLCHKPIVAMTGHFSDGA